ncbi:MAG: hypothetical protein GXO92_06915 [FCB group bacterium]|nr:hypothetical protein [FCB group bacterium]
MIYELLVRDFIDRHDYQTLIDTLDYLEKLGINAIELMPINEFEGNSSWGYNPSFYFAPDKYYGTRQDLKLFIDECHRRGIAVIMDIVLNHTYGQSPLVSGYTGIPQTTARRSKTPGTIRCRPIRCLPGETISITRANIPRLSWTG